MNTEWIVAICAMVTLLLGLVVWMGKLTWMFAQVNIKVDTMWAFSLQRGMLEGIKRGDASYASPYTVSGESLAWFDHNGFAADLRKLYAACPPGIPDLDLAYKIQAQFGERLIREVCVPKGVLAGYTLVVAVAVAKSTNVVDIDGNPTMTRRP